MMCRSELRGLGAIREEINQLGVRLLAVSVDSQEGAHRLAVSLDLNFPILCDTERKVIDAYGLRHKGGGLDGSDIAIPAHVLIDKDGKILSRHVSKRPQDRLDPQRLVATVRALIR